VACDIGRIQMHGQVAALHIGAGLVRMVRIEEHTALPHRVDAKCLARIGKINQTPAEKQRQIAKLDFLVKPCMDLPILD